MHEILPRTHSFRTDSASFSSLSWALVLSLPGSGKLLNTKDTGDTALRLAHFFGTSAQFWLNLQSVYDLGLAQKKVGKSIKALPPLKRSALVHP